MSNSKNVISGVLGGAAIGVLLGLLFAPDKGSETRKKIKKTAIDSKDVVVGKTSEIVDSLASGLSEKSGEFSKDLDIFVSNVSYKADDVITSLENKLAKLKEENKKLQKNGTKKIENKLA